MTDTVDERLNIHEDLLNGPGPALAQVEFDNDYPEELIKIASGVSQTSSQLKSVQSEYEM